MTENPYKSPKTYGYIELRGRTSRLSGPLLLLSTSSFIVALSTSAVSVAPGHEWLPIGLLVISAVFAVFGLICLGSSFHLYRRLKQTNRE